MKKKRKSHKPYNRFKGELRARGLTYIDVANLLGISETAVGFKINGMSDFFISEVEVILKTYNIKLDVFLKNQSCEFNN